MVRGIAARYKDEEEGVERVSVMMKEEGKGEEEKLRRMGNRKGRERKGREEGEGIKGSEV